MEKTLSPLEKYLSKLVSFPTVTKEQHESIRLLDYVQSELPSFFHVTRVRNNGFESLIATTRKKKNPKLFLACHVDVVPASDALFTLKIKRGKLVGRGVADMKFGLACYLQLFKELGSDLRHHDIGLLLTSDEEIGGANGARLLVERGYVPQVLFLPDGGHYWDIQEASKGILQLHINSQGENAHGSRPWEGKDPSWALFDFLQELRKQFPSEPCLDPDHGHNSLNVARLGGGEAVNQVASVLSADLDIRFIPQTNRNNLMKMIRGIQKRYPSIEIAEIAHGTAHHVNRKSPAIRAWTELVAEMRGQKPDFIMSHGSSDARFFDKRHTVTLLTRPECGDLHKETEWISRKGLAEFYQVLKVWVPLVA